ncbi:MAG: hypothetical protein EA384_10770 [Spirochaetaceae bacterium]|nr:MAG: hypothetical protein EA384_10770 [Spirochaetaceae bacterium]
MIDLRSSGAAVRLSLLLLVVCLLLVVLHMFGAPAAERAWNRLVDRAVVDLAGGRSVGPRVAVNRSARPYGPASLAYYALDTGQAYAVHLMVPGHRAPLHLLVEVDNHGTVLAMRMIVGGESLWAVVRAERFLDPFVGSGGDRPIPRSVQQLERDQYEAVSGASITFSVIGEGVLQAVRVVEDMR